MSSKQRDKPKLKLKPLVTSRELKLKLIAISKRKLVKP